MNPDWQEESDYNFCKDLDESHWAWEFLRRNEAYQKSWTKAEKATNGERNYSVLHHFGTKYGLDEIVDPDLDRPILRWDFFRQPMLVTRGSRQYLPLANKTKVAFGYDLSREIGPQVEATRRELKHRQGQLLGAKEIKITRLGNRRGDLILYLRALDAKAQRVTTADMAEVLVPKSYEYDPIERMGGIVKRARSWSRSGYKKMVLMG